MGEPDQQAWPWPGDLAHELAEAKSEIARHHRDFERIRTLVDEALLYEPMFFGRELANALREIRGIVG